MRNINLRQLEAFRAVMMTRSITRASVSAVIIFITMIMMVILDRIFGLDKLLVGK